MALFRWLLPTPEPDDGDAAFGNNDIDNDLEDSFYSVVSFPEEWVQVSELVEQDTWTKSTGEEPLEQDTWTKSTGEEPLEQDTWTKSTGEEPLEQDTWTKSNGEESLEQDTWTKSNGEEPLEQDTWTKSNGEESLEQDTWTKSNGEEPLEQDTSTKANGEEPRVQNTCTNEQGTSTIRWDGILEPFAQFRDVLRQPAVKQGEPPKCLQGKNFDALISLIDPPTQSASESDHERFESNRWFESCEDELKLLISKVKKKKYMEKEGRSKLILSNTFQIVKDSTGEFRYRSENAKKKGTVGDVQQGKVKTFVFHVFPSVLARTLQRGTQSKPPQNLTVGELYRDKESKIYILGDNRKGTVVNKVNCRLYIFSPENTEKRRLLWLYGDKSCCNWFLEEVCFPIQSVAARVGLGRTSKRRKVRKDDEDEHRGPEQNEQAPAKSSRKYRVWVLYSDPTYTGEISVLEDLVKEYSDVFEGPVHKELVGSKAEVQKFCEQVKSGKSSRNLVHISGKGSDKPNVFLDSENILSIHDLLDALASLEGIVQMFCLFVCFSKDAGIQLSKKFQNAGVLFIERFLREHNVKALASCVYEAFSQYEPLYPNTWEKMYGNIVGNARSVCSALERGSLPTIAFHVPYDKTYREHMNLEEVKTAVETYRMMKYLRNQYEEMSAKESSRLQIRRANVLDRYQRDIIEEIQQLWDSGDANAIVYLPCGSGKTVIASTTIALVAACEAEAEKVVIVVVPSTPLVFQQAEAIEACTGLHGGRYCGATNVLDWDIVDKNYDFVVATHGILANLLKERGDANNVFGKISLLVFDECHHAKGKHEYVEIIRALESWQEIARDSRDDEEDVNRLFVLGLSATPTKGKTFSEQKANLDTLRKTCGHHQHQIDGSMKTKGARVLTATLPQSGPDLFENVHVHRVDILSDDLFDKWKTDVEGKLEGLKDQVYKSLLNDFNKSFPQEFPYKDKVGIFGSVLVGEWNNEFGASRGMLPEVAFTTPAVAKLVEILEDISPASRKQDRTIVFVRTRSQAEALVQYLQRRFSGDSYYSFEFIIGSGDQSWEKQDQILNKFHKGEVNVLVATAVLQEGYDIQTCNRVILVTSPDHAQQLMQYTGRIRSSNDCSLHVIGEPKCIMRYKKQQEECQGLEEFRKSCAERPHILNHPSVF
eukprot:CAMPEP_0203764948 /NCGR_PEP_ID=MMETSP0098-20131031/18142_1 /ASSEMBLY_ACC=CAM_ASM_000208 /TAXON_ID=96639 /ORGANISM=" , Strain NY0313808BC1" /LENGTH=1161 /DNA_ID=CAMNT_0050661151 /DNA_START=468 /DNA_END=3953 /DNA_ORIENTATION=+